MEVGRIQRPHGLCGFVRVKPLTDWPERFERLARVSLLQNGELQCQLHIEQVILQANDLLIKFRNIDDRAAAEAARGMTLAINRSDCVKLEAEEFYAFDIIGLNAVDVSGKQIGKLADVVAYPANDVWIIRHGSKEWLIPATQDFVKKVDLVAGRIVVDRIEEVEGE